MFGGIIRNALETDQGTLDRLRTKLIISCMTSSTHLLRAPCTILDDDSKPVYDTCRFAEFVLCYTHAFNVGEFSFQNGSYKMTSEFADKSVVRWLCLESAEDCVNKLFEQTMRWDG
jgi:hypothetical protein